MGNAETHELQSETAEWLQRLICNPQQFPEMHALNADYLKAGLPLPMS